MDRIAITERRKGIERVVATHDETVADYGTCLAEAAILAGDMGCIRHDVFYMESDGSLGRYATYVLPDAVEVNGVLYAFNPDAERYEEWR